MSPRDVLSTEHVVMPKALRDELGDWFIKTERWGGGWGWRVEYPISRFAIVPMKGFASKSSARRDAYRVIRMMVKRRGTRR